MRRNILGITSLAILAASGCLTLNDSESPPDGASAQVGDKATADAPADGVQARKAPLSAASGEDAKPEPVVAEVAEKEESRSDDAPAPVAAARPRPAKAKGKRARRPAGAMGMAPPPAEMPSTESYDRIDENKFIAVADDPRSTFSIDVDTASYANVRRFLTSGSMPPADAVRVEEMINYFSYDYDAPIGKDPFSMSSEVSGSPWNENNLLVSIGLQGQVIDSSEVPARNLVFLLDVSGSMNSPDKLPLLKKGLAMLVDQLRPEDKVSIVVYAGASGVALKPTSGNNKGAILDAMNQLRAGGSTNGGEGIQLAYKLAEQNFVKGGINRVILGTDGDFNVGVASRGELERLIEDKRKTGVFLSVFGFGRGNLKDSQMEAIADKGNGNYAYIDSAREARKVLVEEAGATLVTIAKDVKIQVEFNPNEVASYRLIGYENRKLAHSDFNDDKKDAGEIGAGHSVTALYEVVPASGKEARSTDKLKYQKDPSLTTAADSDELMTVKIRYKQPTGSKSKLLTFPIAGDDRGMKETSKDYRFAASVAEFGMLLRGSEHVADGSYDQVIRLAKGAIGKDPHGHRREFIELAQKAKRISKGKRPLAIAK